MLLLSTKLVLVENASITKGLANDSSIIIVTITIIYSKE